jgi:hypothetical protein
MVDQLLFKQTWLIQVGGIPLRPKSPINWTKGKCTNVPQDVPHSPSAKIEAYTKLEEF